MDLYNSDVIGVSVPTDLVDRFESAKKEYAKGGSKDLRPCIDAYPSLLQLYLQLEQSLWIAKTDHQWRIVEAYHRACFANERSIAGGDCDVSTKERLEELTPIEEKYQLLLTKREGLNQRVAHLIGTALKGMPVHRTKTGLDANQQNWEEELQVALQLIDRQNQKGKDSD